MDIAIVTGSSGLIGSESVRFFSDKFDHIVGIDNNMRKYFFGEMASTEWNREMLESEYPNFTTSNIDIRDRTEIERIFEKYNSDIKLLIHTAAQPSHDWAAKEPFTDFSINANGTLNMLEFTRKYAPKSVFIFTSTNKVYGDRPNSLPLVELESRWELAQNHVFYEDGIDESMSIDQCKHSLFGASKVSADILCQEYGRYFDLATGIFRGGCLTGPGHSGTQLHGFLSYLMKCTISGEPYTVFGYKGKQVRDNIHSWDLVNMFWHFYMNPRIGEVYNVGGGRHSNCSMLEAIRKCELISGRELKWTYSESSRKGDHMWWISNVNKFKNHFPEWGWKYNLDDILVKIHESASKHV